MFLAFARLKPEYLRPRANALCPFHTQDYRPWIIRIQKVHSLKDGDNLDLRLLDFGVEIKGHSKCVISEKQIRWKIFATGCETRLISFL